MISIHLGFAGSLLIRSFASSLLRCAKNLNNGRVEVWACYTPPGTDGEGVTNGYIQYRLWPDPDPNYLQGDYVEPIHACRYNKVVQ